jgi:hypothetical protein
MMMIGRRALICLLLGITGEEIGLVLLSGAREPGALTFEAGI